MTKEDLLELTRIIERYIPLGSDRSLCHVGICSINRCNRCEVAFKVREILKRVENEPHDALFSITLKDKRITVHGDNDSINELQKILTKRVG